jgi:hypothetical protein
MNSLSMPDFEPTLLTFESSQSGMTSVSPPVLPIGVGSCQGRSQSRVTLAPSSVTAGGRTSRVWSVLLIGAEVLPWKISVKGGACAIASATRPRRALDGDLCAARGCPARGGRPGQITQARSSGQRYGPEPPACGCGPADRRAAPRP